MIKHFSQNILPIIFDKPYVSFPISESSKSWDSLKFIIDEAVRADISRKGAFVAIGGGVLTDMAGLAANLYFRGINIILVPTTLLGMVDAAVGGKVAINHPHQKNMIGSFYHSIVTYMSIDFLKTLPYRHMVSAAGEIFKLSVLSNSNLFSILEKTPDKWYQNIEFLNAIVRLSVIEKLSMLGENCFERNLERTLNLGHSIAHPLEDITEFRILHGEAVAYGVLIACNISKQRKMLSEKVYSKIVKVALNLGINKSIDDYEIEKLWVRTRRLIKQRGGDGLLYVLPTNIGSASIVSDISYQEFQLAISKLKN